MLHQCPLKARCSTKWRSASTHTTSGSDPEDGPRPRDVTRSAALPGGTLVLASKGLAKAVPRDRAVTELLALARADVRVITGAATRVKVAHLQSSRPALAWARTPHRGRAGRCRRHPLGTADMSDSTYAIHWDDHLDHQLNNATPWFRASLRPTAPTQGSNLRPTSRTAETPPPPVVPPNEGSAATCQQPRITARRHCGRRGQSSRCPSLRLSDRAKPRHRLPFRNHMTSSANCPSRKADHIAPRAQRVRGGSWASADRSWPGETAVHGQPPQGSADALRATLSSNSR